jgi:hypothetical protein
MLIQGKVGNVLLNSYFCIQRDDQSSFMDK